MGRSQGPPLEFAQACGDVRLLHEMADIHLSEGGVEEMMQVALRILDIAPNDPDVLHQVFLACSLYGEEHDELSERVARHGLEIDPRSVDLLGDLASLASPLHASGVSNDEALDLYERAVRLAPDQCDLLFNYASFFIELLVGRSRHWPMPGVLSPTCRQANRACSERLSRPWSQS
jgi:hypothetical protein